MKKIINSKRARWSRRDLILFFERLELYISAGLPLNHALEILTQDASKKSSKTIETIRNKIETGAAFSNALKNIIIIPSTIIGLLAHGESSGELAKALDYSKQLLEREDELVKKCASAMTYPAVIGFFALAFTIGLMKGVMPQIIPMLKSLRVELPLLTRVVMFVSDSLTKYGVYALLGAVALVIAMSIICVKSRLARSACQSAISRVPIVGQLVYSYFTAVFIRSLGSLVESGMPVAPSYFQAVSATSFIPLKKSCLRHIDTVSRGVSLGSVFGKVKRLPKFVSSLVRAGEATGSLGISLTRCASIIDRDIEHSLKRLTSLVEPVMMAGMGGAVGAIALSIIMPIYDISKVLQR